MSRSRRDRTNAEEGSRATLAPGQLAVPSVRLTRKIAEGGMGSVWEGQHLALHTTVAVKFVLAELGDNEEAVARFEREATAAARIKSPHVVQMLDHGITENEGVPYIVMELLEGEDLEARLLREPRLPLELVAHIVAQAAKALGRAHSIGIVHRDIKPSNVFLSDVGGETFVKLLDFGIARLSMTDVGRARVTQTGAMLGTPIFMSPEQMTHAKDVGPGADIWSLGVVAYLSITGRLPFDEETIAGIAMAIERGEYPTPTEILPQLPTELDEWFAKIFQKDPKKRYPTAKEMADALLRIAQIPLPPSSLAHTSTPPPPPAPGTTRTSSDPPREPLETEDEPTHVENKGQVAARVAAAAAAAAAANAKATGDRGAGRGHDLGDTEAGKKTLARKTPAGRVDPRAERDSDAPDSANLAEDDADTPSEDIEITTAGGEPASVLERAEELRKARLPEPVMAKTASTSASEPPVAKKGPSTVMGVSGGDSQPGAERRSKSLWIGLAAVALVAMLGVAYAVSAGDKNKGTLDTATPAPSTAAAPSAAPSASIATQAAPSATAEQASSSAPTSAPSASAAHSAAPSSSPPKPPPPAHPAVPGPMPKASADPASTAAPKPAPADTATPKAPSTAQPKAPVEAPKAPAPAPSH